MNIFFDHPTTLGTPTSSISAIGGSVFSKTENFMRENGGKRNLTHYGTVTRGFIILGIPGADL